MTKKEITKEISKNIKRVERLMAKKSAIAADITATMGAIEFWKTQLEKTEE